MGYFSESELRKLVDSNQGSIAIHLGVEKQQKRFYSEEDEIRIVADVSAVGQALNNPTP